MAELWTRLQRRGWSPDTIPTGAGHGTTVDTDTVERYLSDGFAVGDSGRVRTTRERHRHRVSVVHLRWRRTAIGCFNSCFTVFRCTAVIVTGAYGRYGTTLVSHLHDAERYNFTYFNRSDRPNGHPYGGYDTVIGDVADAGALRRVSEDGCDGPHGGVPPR